jgi:branched-chain amino acid aminotransferase
MIEEIGYKNHSIHISNNNPVGQMVLDTINKVRVGEIQDELSWMVKV